MGWLELIGCHLLVFCINLIVPGFVIYYFNRANHKLMYVFSLFWPKKVHFKANIYNFLTFMLINFLMRTLQCTKSVVLFRPWKYETTTLKSRIYLQNCRTFSYCWPAQNQPKCYVVFIPFWYLGLWLFLVTKFQKILHNSLSIFISSCSSCLANGKHHTENPSTKVTNITKNKVTKMSRALNSVHQK